MKKIKFLISFCALTTTLSNVSMGQTNTSYGTNAGSGGYYNSSFGYSAGDVVTADGNSFFGYQAGSAITTGPGNVFIGMWSGQVTTTGKENTFIGKDSGYSNETGNDNVYIGEAAGLSNTSGSYNVAIGEQSASFSYTGDYNTFLGAQTGLHSEGSRNVFIGYRAGLSEYGSDKLYIDNSETTAPLIYGDFSTRELTFNGRVAIQTTSHAHPLHVRWAYCDGNSWYNASDKNLKENFARIKQEESILAKVMELPIQYWNYKGDNANRHIGPTAQDFHRVFKLGSNDRAISTIDESGVSLAAIQELNREMQKLNQLVKEQEQLVASLLQSRIADTDDNIGTPENGLKLYQNQPNPFQRDTKISMEIPDEVSHAVLYIYDLQGKAIEQQVIAGRGLTSMIIEGGMLTSGIYLYTLIADGQSAEVKRMILTD